MSVRTLFGAVALSLVVPLGAQSAVLEPFDLISQYALVTSGDVDNRARIEGRGYVGGTLSGSSLALDLSDTDPFDYADLIVVGDVSVPQITVTASRDTSFVIGGVNDAAIAGQTPQSDIVVGELPGALAPEFPAATLMGLSDQLGATEANSVETVTGQETLLRLNSAPSFGRTIYDITFADLNRGEIEIDLNGADLVIINVTGGGVVASILRDLSDTDAASKVIWNFIDATDVTLGDFWGHILAPFAQVTSTTSLSGSLYANTAQLDGVLSHHAFTGDMASFDPAASQSVLVPVSVPLPAGILFLISGVSVLGGVRRLAA